MLAASLYEGGIRVPGILEWPAMIKHNSATWYPAYVSDYLPTLLELTGVQHAHPDWAADGISLLPLIKRLAAAPNSNDTSSRPAEHPLFFKLGKQVALIDNDWKIIENPSAGHCKPQPKTSFKGRMLFHLGDDPTESRDLAKSQAAVFATMAARLDAYMQGVAASQTNESGCNGKSETPAGVQPDEPVADPGSVGGIMPACKSDEPRPPRGPPSPPRTAVRIQAPSGGCLAANQSAARAGIRIAACSVGGTALLQRWQLGDQNQLFLASNVGGSQPTLCLKPVDAASCIPGGAIWLGMVCQAPHGFVVRNSTIELALRCNPRMCLAQNSSSGGMLHLAGCSDPNAIGWTFHSDTGEQARPGGLF